MTTYLNEEIVLAFALPILAVVTQSAISVRKRVGKYAKSQCIARIAQMIMTTEEPTDEEIRQLRLHFSLGTILDAVIFISEHIYGNALNRLSLVVEVCEVDYYLLRRIRREEVHRKALLAKLSRLTHATIVAEYAEVYLDNEHRSTRFYAIAALVAAHPDRAIRYITKFDTALTWYEAALLTQLMRRTGAPIAYTPLLTSHNRNLQLIGIYLCDHFSIVDAESHLQLLAESNDSELSYMALLTLCSIRGDIASPYANSALLRLMPYQRMTFIRHAVQACYSLRSCAKLLSRQERAIFAQQIDSYKCRIVCN